MVTFRITLINVYLIYYNRSCRRDLKTNHLLKIATPLHVGHSVRRIFDAYLRLFYYAFEIIQTRFNLSYLLELGLPFQL